MLTCWHPDPEKRPNFAELAEVMGEGVAEALKEVSTGRQRVGQHDTSMPLLHGHPML